MRTGSNRVDPNHEHAPNLEANHQNPNPHPDLNIGSRFRASAALDLNMVTEDHEIEVEVDKDTTSNLVTNSDLVGTEQVEFRAVGHATMAMEIWGIRKEFHGEINGSRL